MTKYIQNITALLTILLFLGCHDTTAPTEPDPISQAQIKLKSDNNYRAGHPIWMMIQTPKKKVNAIELVISNGLYTTSLKERTNKKIKLDSSLFENSGLYDFIILERGEVLTKRQIKIKSSDIIEPLDLYTGPSSIIVGGKQNSMVTAIPTDRYDNAIFSKNPINVKSKRGERINHMTSIKNHVASQQITSKKKSGKIILGVTLDKNTSREQEILETPDWPTSFTISLIKQYPYADNRQYLKLRTSRITDKYGNQIADGTLVNFHAFEDNKVSSIYKAIVIDGIANVYIRNPNQACNWSIHASIGPTVSSNEIKVNFLNNIKELVYTYDDFLKQITIGPLKSEQGQFTPDGTEVILLHQGKKYEGETYNGLVTFNLVELGILTKDKVEISAGGFKHKVQLR